MLQHKSPRFGAIRSPRAPWRDSRARTPGSADDRVSTFPVPRSRPPVGAHRPIHPSGGSSRQESLLHGPIEDAAPPGAWNPDVGPGTGGSAAPHRCPSCDGHSADGAARGSCWNDPYLELAMTEGRTAATTRRRHGVLVDDTGHRSVVVGRLLIGLAVVCALYLVAVAVTLVTPAELPKVGLRTSVSSTPVAGDAPLAPSASPVEASQTERGASEKRASTDGAQP